MKQLTNISAAFNLRLLISMVAVFFAGFFVWLLLPLHLREIGLVGSIGFFVGSYIWFEKKSGNLGSHAESAGVGASKSVSGLIKKSVARLISVAPKRMRLSFSEAENLPIALVTLTNNGRVKIANRAARKLLHIQPGEDPNFSDLVGGMGQQIDQWLIREFDNPSPPRPQMLTATRSPNDVYLQVSFVKNIESQPGAFTAVLTDATELKTLEAQFVQSQKMQAIGQLAGGVAHDFNNLLTAISGYCDLLMLRHERGDPDYADLTQISQNANRAASLVGQLLAFSRKQKLKPSAVNVNETISDLAHLLNRLVGEKINLQFVRGKALPKAFVDSRQLEQVIMNLVVNARDAMPKGGEIVIETRKARFDNEAVEQGARISPGTYIQIEVKDAGTGISPEMLPKIFEPFVSTKNVGEGTGLGLSTTYGIVKQTGGYIFVDSKVNVGTSFRVLLPEVLKGFKAFQDHPEKDTKKKQKRSGLAGARILLAEDEVPVRALIKRALTMQGVELIEAGSAEEALEFVHEMKDTIDVIISDVVMPGRDGPSWVAEGLRICKSAKVIFISGYAEDSLKPESVGLKDYEFLPKPFSLKQLTETVSRILD